MLLVSAIPLYKVIRCSFLFAIIKNAYTFENNLIKINTWMFYVENEYFFLPIKKFEDHSWTINPIYQELQNMQKQFYNSHTNYTKWPYRSEQMMCSTNTLKVIDHCHEVVRWVALCLCVQSTVLIQYTHRSFAYTVTLGIPNYLCRASAARAVVVTPCQITEGQELAAVWGPNSVF